MAIIGRKMPSGGPSSSYVRRVVVKFRPGVALPYSMMAQEELARRQPQQWEALQRQFGGVRLMPLFLHAGENAVRSLERAAAQGGESGAVLSSYFAVEVPDGQDADAVARAIMAWPDVEYARVEGGPAPPPLDPDDDPLSGDQKYLEAAPKGIDARIAWTLTTGTGIGVVDLEQGWTLNHDDLVAANIAIISGVNKQFKGHGTAVLGELTAVDNDIGGIGIATSSTTRVISQWRTDNTFSTADAIVDAAAAMKAGDVLLLEAQTSHPNADGFMPVEVDDWVFFPIKAAVAKGIIVVEAAGNGSVDLDAFTNVFGKTQFNRNSPDFADSGAIMVGAASSVVPHQRLDFSNFGSRIDCYGWGENITTSGEGFAGDDAHIFINDFGGTSGASPMITGAAALVQSWRLKNGGVLTPAQMRDLLSDVKLNTASADPPSDRIGVMPNLKAIFEHLGVFFPIRLDLGRWAAVVFILFGVIEGGGGVIIKPGGGGGPIGPDGPIGPLGPEFLAPEKRNVLLGLALTELAALAADGQTRRSIEQLGIATMRGAVEQLAGARLA